MLPCRTTAAAVTGLTTIENLPDANAMTFNSGNYQTIFVYLVYNASSMTPTITCTVTSPLVKDRLTALEQKMASWSDSTIAALLACFRNVAWINDRGAAILANLQNALIPPAEPITTNGWIDGVPYSDIQVVAGEYVKPAGNGSFVPATTWSRTGYLPCLNAARIVFPPIPNVKEAASGNCFYTENKTPISGFEISTHNVTYINVPANAAYFCISGENDALATCLSGDITPFAE